MNGRADNVIYNPETDDVIGYYRDLQAMLTEDAVKALKDRERERLEDLLELMNDLDDWKESPNLLVMSENNGMGYTIKEYKGE